MTMWHDMNVFYSLKAAVSSSLDSKQQLPIHPSIRIHTPVCVAAPRGVYIVALYDAAHTAMHIICVICGSYAYNVLYYMYIICRVNTSKQCS